MVRLHPAYADIAALERRFQHRPPSLVAALHLVVEGDVTLGWDVQMRGEASTRAECHSSGKQGQFGSLVQVHPA